MLTSPIDMKSEDPQHSTNGHALHTSAAIPPPHMPHLDVIPQSLSCIDWGITSTWALGPPLWAPAVCN